MKFSKGDADVEMGVAGSLSKLVSGADQALVSRVAEALHRARGRTFSTDDEVAMWLIEELRKHGVTVEL